MHTPLSSFDYLCPESMDNLIAILKQNEPETILTAGGTDLIPALKDNRINPKRIIDIGRITDLKGIFLEGDSIRIGATTTLSEIEQSDIIENHSAALASAAAQIGNAQIRNRATIGGNISNASPAADMAPALLALNAEAIITGIQGERTLPMSQFFQGYQETALQNGDVLKAFVIPVDSAVSCFSKLGKRNGACLSIAAVAVSLLQQGEICTDVRIALGAVAPTPIRAYKSESVLKGNAISIENIVKAATVASEETSPVTDLRAGKEYRKTMCEVLVNRCLSLLVQH